VTGARSSWNRLPLGLRPEGFPEGWSPPPEALTRPFRSFRRGSSRHPRPVFAVFRSPISMDRHRRRRSSGAAGTSPSSVSSGSRRIPSRIGSSNTGVRPEVAHDRGSSHAGGIKWPFLPFGLESRPSSNLIFARFFAIGTRWTGTGEGENREATIRSVKRNAVGNQGSFVGSHYQFSSASYIVS